MLWMNRGKKPTIEQCALISVEIRPELEADNAIWQQIAAHTGLGVKTAKCCARETAPTFLKRHGAVWVELSKAVSVAAFIRKMRGIVAVEIVRG